MRIMGKDSQRNEDLKEIFLHIKQIKLEKNQIEDVENNKIKPVETIQKNVGINDIELDNIPPEDIFEIVGSADDFSEENYTKMKENINLVGKCDICGQKIDFEKNLSGLVIKNSVFACEKCCIDKSKDELINWTESKMTNPKDIQPIALWLMQEKNKNKLFEK
jgi:hypothetical protein